MVWQRVWRVLKGEAGGPISDKIATAIAIALAAAGVIVTFVALVVSWDQPILEAHGFRQTQTAISSYWLAKGGPFLAYETPVFGAPWAVPFEFPLYQWIVAMVSRAGVDLDNAGRLVSWSFFMLAMWQLWSLVRRLSGSWQMGLFMCGLVMLSPYYLFWSRTFMIESTALFFCIAFINVVVRHVREPTRWTGVAMPVLATLGALVKVTTFIGIGPVAGLIVLWDLRIREHRRDRQRWLRRYIPVAAAGVCAVAIASWWTHYADVVKLRHLIASNVTSKHLHAWLYGTLEQRLNGAFWRQVVFGRTLDETLAITTPLFFVYLAATVMMGRRAIVWTSLLLALYILPFLVFTNLHAIHNYYQYPNALWLICAIAVALWLAPNDWRRLVSLALVAFLLVRETRHTRRIEWPVMVANLEASKTLILAGAIRDLPEDGVILAFGFDWSAELAYYADHRAIMVPMWINAVQLYSLKNHIEMHSGGQKIVAVVECPNSLRGGPLAAAVDDIITSNTRGMSEMQIGDCRLWR